MFNHKIVFRSTPLLIILLMATGSGCSKTHSATEPCLSSKWQLVAKSGDGNTWQGVPASEVYFVEFSPNGVLHYSDKNTTCSGTYTIAGEELVTDLSACSANIYFSHRIMQQSASILILRPNSGAILPYTKYTKVH